MQSAKCRMVNNTKKEKPHCRATFLFLVTRTGIDRLLRLRLAYYRLGLRLHHFLLKIVHRTIFLTASAIGVDSFKIVYTKTKEHLVALFCFWWIRGESNPCPKLHSRDFLRVQSVIEFRSRQFIDKLISA